METQLANARRDETGSVAMELPQIVSLFSGAGGLDLGFKQAGFPIAYAIDKSRWAIETHKRNFPDTLSEADDLTVRSPISICDSVSRVVPAGATIGVIGGPPCQGFSRANTGAMAEDPRNKLPTVYLDIVSALKSRFNVEFILFENVLGIRDAKHAEIYSGILSYLARLGFHDKVDEYCALDYGVPQVRRRVIISGFRRADALNHYSSVAQVPERLQDAELTVRSAISGLPAPLYFDRGLRPQDIPHHPNHWTMRPKSPRFSQADSRTSGRSFKRLDWDKPSPTVAYGHREIHIHPDGHRRLSIYEAMLLQGFPQDFELMGPLSAQVEQVSNAVPPPLAKILAGAVASTLPHATPIQGDSSAVAS